MATRERDCGIDLLRLLSMFLVVVYHLLFHGGILEEGGLFPRLLWAMTLCAVDCFGLMSGYVGYREEAPRLLGASSSAACFCGCFPGMGCRVPSSCSGTIVRWCLPCRFS